MIIMDGKSGWKVGARVKIVKTYVDGNVQFGDVEGNCSHFTSTKK